MFSLVLKVLLSFFVLNSVVFASEEKAEAPDAQKEIKSDEESFGVVQARVQGLEAKVRSAQEELKKLIEEKHQTKDEAKVSEIIKRMITVHREMEINAREYDQQRALLNYRYPEKGQSEKRKYERIEVKSIEEMEGQMSLSGAVKRTMRKVRSQYGMPESPAKGQAPTESSSGKTSPGLAEPVILKK